MSALLEGTPFQEEGGRGERALGEEEEEPE